MFDDAILTYQLFHDRDGDVQIVSNRMVVTRKKHVCCVCFETIAAKTRCRAQSEINRDDDTAGTFYACPDCCQAMRMQHIDDGEAIARRWQVGAANVAIANNQASSATARTDD